MFSDVFSSAPRVSGMAAPASPLTTVMISFRSALADEDDWVASTILHTRLCRALERRAEETGHAGFPAEAANEAIWACLEGDPSRVLWVDGLWAHACEIVCELQLWPWMVRRERAWLN